MAEPSELDILKEQLRRKLLDQQKGGIPAFEKSRRREEIDALRRQIAALSAAERGGADQRLIDEAAFWYRRFFTTLSIANAAGFAALATGFLQADNKGEIAVAVAPAMTAFAVGMGAAGAIPLILWAGAEMERLGNNGVAIFGEKRGVSVSLMAFFGSTIAMITGYALAIVSVVAFVWALMEAIGGVRGFVVG